MPSVHIPAAGNPNRGVGNIEISICCCLLVGLRAVADCDGDALGRIGRRCRNWILCLKQGLYLFCTLRISTIRLNCRVAGDGLLSRSSSAFTYPRLGPLFLLTSSYAHECPSLVHVLQLGLTPSHFSFRFRHIMHARRFGLGTVELPPSGGLFSAPFDPFSPLESVFMAVSGEGFDMSVRAGLCDGGDGESGQPEAALLKAGRS